MSIERERASWIYSGHQQILAHKGHCVCLLVIRKKGDEAIDRCPGECEIINRRQDRYEATNVGEEF